MQLSYHFNSTNLLIKCILLPAVNETMLENAFSLKSNFDWSFRPITVFLRCFGIELSSPSTKRFDSLLSNGYALIWFMLNLGLNIYIRFLSNFSFAKTLTDLYYRSTHVIFTIAYVGSHLILLFLIRPRFAAVMRSFRLLGRCLQDEKMFFRIRRFSIVCFGFAFILVFY
jgi:hypothetical protein